MAFDFNNFQVAPEENIILKDAKVQWSELLRVTFEEINKFIKTDKEGDYVLDFESKPILMDKCVPGDIHVYTNINQAKSLNVLKITCYPAYIYSPLRVLNQWVSEFFPQSLKELEQIISKGELTFGNGFPLGLGSVGNHPFVLSKLKAEVIIILVNGKTFNQNKSDGILSQDGFACYLHYEILGKSYPVILINAEDLEALFIGKKRAENIILAYQFDILEMFAHAIKEAYPEAYDGDSHYAFNLAYRFLQNFGKKIQLYYKTVQHFFDIDEDVYVPIKEEDLKALNDEVETMHENGELFDDELESGIFGEGIVDIIDWKKKYILFMDEFCHQEYEHPVSVDLKHPYTWWAV